MKVALITDAWTPQVNGVVTTLKRTIEELEALGHRVAAITPQGFRTVPCPGDGELRLAVLPYRQIVRRLDAFAPDAIHIATEGPLGSAARRYCLRRKLPFSTAWHTQFPDYLQMRFGVPQAWTYAWLRRFHRPATHTMVATASQRDRLRRHGVDKLVAWGRGVDTQLFRPQSGTGSELPRPIAMYVGRVAVEKNLDAFLSLDLPGTQVIVGDGPARARLQTQYPRAHFTGYLHGAALAAMMAGADVFVFPSRTDTFGLVMLEAMACGVPVAAYPVTGPRDVVRQGETGCLDEDLGQAIRGALRCRREACVDYAVANSWRAAAQQFMEHLVPIRTAPGATPTPTAPAGGGLS